MRRSRTLLRVGSAMLCIAAYACGGDGSTPPLGPEDSDPTGGPDTASVVGSIGVRPSQLYIDSLAITRQTSARALAEDGGYLYSSLDHPDRFSWSSSAPDILSVDQNGLTTSESWGVATITAEHDGDLAGSIRVVVGDAVHPAWSLTVGPGIINADIAVGADGTIYVGTNDAAADRSSWRALSPDGSILWTLGLPPTGFSSPAIGVDGTLYFGSQTPSAPSESAGSLTAVNPDGTVRWVLEGIHGVGASPAIGPDGTIYMARGRHLYAVDPDGEIRWTWEHEDRVFFRSSPAVGSDGTIYVGGENDLLYAINPDGSPRWTFATEDRIRSSPSIAKDGTIYFGSHDGRLYALHPDGTERWRVEMRCGLPWGCQPVQGSPSIGPDGTIYVGAGGLFALAPDGSVLWNYEPSTSVTTAVVGADGTLYFGSFRGITALDAQGRMMWHYPGVGHTAAIHGAPAIGVDGTIFSTSFSESNRYGTVHAYVETDPTNGGYAAAAWPTGRGNRANTGRAGG